MSNYDVLAEKCCGSCLSFSGTLCNVFDIYTNYHCSCLTFVKTDSYTPRNSINNPHKLVLDDVKIKLLDMRKNVAMVDIDIIVCLVDKLEKERGIE